MPEICMSGSKSLEPDMQISRLRLSDKTSRLHPRHVVPKPAQAYGGKDPDFWRAFEDGEVKVIGKSLQTPTMIRALQRKARRRAAAKRGRFLSGLRTTSNPRSARRTSRRASPCAR